MKLTKQSVEAFTSEPQTETEDSAALIEEIVNSIVSQYSSELDQYVDFVRGLLDDDKTDISNDELDYIIMKLPTYLYFIGANQERLGIREDISDLALTEMYNSTLLDTDGAAIVKQANAKLLTEKENLSLIVYKRASRMLKQKIDAAYEIINCCKKVLTRRLAELELSHISPNISRGD